MTSPPAKPRFAASSAFFYATCLPRIQQIAADHGYAVALHGSMQRDFDVLCVPWVEGATSAKTLIESLADEFSCVYGRSIVHGPEDKPHGRRAWSIIINGQGRYLDVSITPRVKERSADE